MDYYIKDPGLIIERNLATGEVIKTPDGKDAPPLTTKSLFANTLGNDVRFYENFKAVRAAHNIVDALDHQRGGWWKISDSDYDLLKQVIDKPKFRDPRNPEKFIEGYPSGAFVLAFPIVNSIMCAVTEPPEEWKNAA